MDITSSNAKFSILVPGVFPTPYVLQQFATDDAWASEEVEVAQVVMGVDGNMSAGSVPYLIHQDIVFQADSASIMGIMEPWRAANAAAVSQGATQNFASSGTLTVPAISITYALTKGVLLRITPFPQGKKILQPVRYRITWNGYQALPIA